MPNPNYKYYPTELKIEALEMLRTSGKSMTQIERELRISPNLLARWKARLVVELKRLCPTSLYLHPLMGEGWGVGYYETKLLRITIVRHRNWPYSS